MVATRGTIACFHAKWTFDERRAESTRILTKYPDRVPVIAVHGPHCTLPHLDKSKYLCPSHLTIGEFCYVLRKRVKLPPATGMFLFTEHGTLPPTSMTLRDLYSNNRNPDGYVYIVYAGENAFG